MSTDRPEVIIIIIVHVDVDGDGVYQENLAHLY